MRALLKLDLGYYSSGDDSWLREKIHQMKVAGKQVLERPALILNVVKSLGLKGVLLAEKRRILLDSETPEPKQRWNEAHEIIHDLVPWHDGIAHGDPETTLSPGCHELIEAEANYGAGRLLFLGNGFDEVVRSCEINFAAVQALKKGYGNTMTTTLWRVVELSLDASWGLVSKHPRAASGPLQEDIRYYIRSRRFAAEFGRVGPPTMRVSLLFDGIVIAHSDGDATNVRFCSEARVGGGRRDARTPSVPLTPTTGVRAMAGSAVPGSGSRRR